MQNKTPTNVRAPTQSWASTTGTNRSIPENRSPSSTLPPSNCLKALLYIPQTSALPAIIERVRKAGSNTNISTTELSPKAAATTATTKKNATYSTATITSSAAIITSACSTQAC